MHTRVRDNVMSESAVGLLESIRALPSMDRDWITEQLVIDQSMSGDQEVHIEPEFLSMIEDRLRDARQHPEKLIDGDTVLENARKRMMARTT